jgi:hypothetical protein
MKIALCLFAYNRPNYLRRALKTHIKISGLSYYAFIDKSDKQKEVMDIIHDSHIYDVLIPRQEHFGLNRNIREGIDWAFMDSDAVIVLEDDLLLSRDAIFYLINGLRGDTAEAISCDTGEGFKCWAWGIKKKVWDKIDWTLIPKEKNRGSWDVIVAENFKQKDWFCSCSDKPRVKHIGWSGTHYSFLDLFSIRRLWHYIGIH